MGFILRQHLKFHNYVQLSIPLISEFCYKARHPLTRMTCGTFDLYLYIVSYYDHYISCMATTFNHSRTKSSVCTHSTYRACIS